MDTLAFLISLNTKKTVINAHKIIFKNYEVIIEKNSQKLFSLTRTSVTFWNEEHCNENSADSCLAQQIVSDDINFVEIDELFLSIRDKKDYAIIEITLPDKSDLYFFS